MSTSEMLIIPALLAATSSLGLLDFRVVIVYLQGMLAVGLYFLTAKRPPMNTCLAAAALVAARS